MSFEHPPLEIAQSLALELEPVQAGQLDGEAARAALGRMLQAALELEFAAIPVYLSAAFSHGGGNRQISQLILRAAIEEMLHFTIVANTMNAIGVAPNIAAAIPQYPCDIDVVKPPLHLELRPFSFDLVRDVFLRIETPEEPLEFRAADAAKTVGQFYMAIIEIIENQTIPNLFSPATRFAPVCPGPPNFDEVAYRSDTDLAAFLLPNHIDFRIIDAASASLHLRWLVDQGEGTSKSDINPIDASGLPAHYYRFVSILRGKYLVANAAAPSGFSYTGGSLPYDPTLVHISAPNPKAADYAAHQDLKLELESFNAEYSEMINHLIKSFQCQDEAAALAAYNPSLGNMRRVARFASNILAEAVAAGVNAGPPFEYLGP
jgi:Ferritin-like